MVLGFEDVEGRQPTLPWTPAELDLVVTCCTGITEALTPSPLTVEQAGRAESWGVVNGNRWEKLQRECPDRLDEWTRRNLDVLIELESTAVAAVAGETLVHLDLRDDNLLLTQEGVMVLDWTHARIGAPWLDLILLAPSVAMQGGPPPESLMSRHPAARAADPTALTAALVAIAGSLTYGGMQPPPPGLPTLPAFMEAQAAEARRWLRVRIRTA